MAKAKLAMEIRKADRALDSRISETRILMPAQRLAMLDQLLEESLLTIQSLDIDRWLAKLPELVGQQKNQTKAIMNFMIEGSGIAVARAKNVAVATQVLKELGTLIRKEIKSRPDYGALLNGMTPEEIEQCEDEEKLKGLAQASLKRLAGMGLLTRDLLITAADSLPPELVPDMGPPSMEALLPGDKPEEKDFVEL